MTGVAAQYCSHEQEISSIGYKVLISGVIHDKEGKKISNVGNRNVILNDLAPVASFISNCFNSNFDFSDYKNKLLNLIDDVEREFGWMFETIHLKDNQPQYDLEGNLIKGKINYVVWSDVFTCPACTSELKYWDIAKGLINKKVESEFLCPSCKVEVNKRNLQRKFVSNYDIDLNQTVTQAKFVPVLISHSIGTTRYEDSR